MSVTQYYVCRIPGSKVDWRSEFFEGIFWNDAGFRLRRKTNQTRQCSFIQ